VTPVAENQPVVRPPSFSTTATITILLLDGKTPENAIINGVGNNWSAANVQQIRGLIGANEAFLVWSQLGQPNCRYRISLAAQPRPAAPSHRLPNHRPRSHRPRSHRPLNHPSPSHHPLALAAAQSAGFTGRTSVRSQVKNG
jgi:hypothetical protein